MDRIKNNNEFYSIKLLNSVKIKVNKNTNEVYFIDRGDSDIGKYTQEYSKAILKAWDIMETSPNKSYQPTYLDPNLYVGQASTLLEFNGWRDLYLQDPPKCAIAPWTKKEKAYYESLKTKRERYKYLVIRSGLRSSVIDIPLDAIAGVDENGKLINPKYEELYKEVEANRGLAHLSDGSLMMSEWNLAAGMLGDIKGFYQSGTLGFNTRYWQIYFLVLQLNGGGKKKARYDYIPVTFLDYIDKIRYGFNGIHKDTTKAQMLTNIAKNIKPDEYGMLPYLDELIGVNWVMDFNKTHTTNENKYVIDSSGDITRDLEDKITQGLIKDPRDRDSTKESRIAFSQGVQESIWDYRDRYEQDLPNKWDEQTAKRYINTMLLAAKIASITPPQGYPNAPTYFIPEELENIYQEHKLDKKLNPTIPAMYRYDFPEYLREEIEAYAKKHNIKE